MPKRTRTQTANDLVTYCFAFVHEAHRNGYVNTFTADLVWSLAHQHGLEPDTWSMRTVKSIARRRAEDMNEAHLIDFGKDAALSLTRAQGRAFLAVLRGDGGTLSRGSAKGIGLPTLRALERLGLIVLTVEAGKSRWTGRDGRIQTAPFYDWTATATDAGRRASNLISAIHERPRKQQTAEAE